jgi:Bacterial Ig-like domain/Insecticidal Crystal Toxin, P42
VAIPEPTRCCFYFIEEGTKNEHVAVGSTGNILRWAKTNGPEQQWLLIPISDQKCKIMTRQNGEYMGVGWNGNILRWADSGGPDQQFSFVNQDSTGRWNIQEGTRNEFVAVGWDGNILRWAQSNKNDQRFKLVAAPGEKAKPAVQPGQYQPGQIPVAPRITEWGQAPPERSPLYLIGEMTVPAVLVNDGGFSGKIPQVETSPYYVLSRHQYWDRSSGRGAYRQYEEALERSDKYVLKVGFEATQSSQIEHTLSTKITEKGEFSFKLGGTVSGIELGVTGTASIQREFTEQLKVTTSTETTSMTEETKEVAVKIPPGKHARVLWTRVDRYTLRRLDGTLIGDWEVVSKSDTDEQSYSPPEDPATPIEDPTTPPRDVTAPRVTTVSPASGRSGVARDTNVTASFSEKMDATTITESTFQLFRLDPHRDPSQINNVTINLSSDGLTATLNPSARLEAKKKYRARITTGATDAAGNQLAATKDWTFTTEKG